MAKKVDPLKAKAAKQRKMAIGLGVMLLAVVAFQGPKTLKLLKGPPTAPWPRRARRPRPPTRRRPRPVWFHRAPRRDPCCRYDVPGGEPSPPFSSTATSRSLQAQVSCSPSSSSRRIRSSSSSTLTRFPSSVLGSARSLALQPARTRRRPMRAGSPGPSCPAAIQVRPRWQGTCRSAAAGSGHDALSQR